MLLTAEVVDRWLLTERQKRQKMKKLVKKRPWISWCPALGFRVALQKFGVRLGCRMWKRWSRLLSQDSKVKKGFSSSFSQNVSHVIQHNGIYEAHISERSLKFPEISSKLQHLKPFDDRLPWLDGVTLAPGCACCFKGYADTQKCARVVATGAACKRVGCWDRKRRKMKTH